MVTPTSHTPVNLPSGAPVTPEVLNKGINTVAGTLDGTSVASKEDLAALFQTIGNSLPKIRGQIQRLLDEADPSNPNIPIIEGLLADMESANAGNPFLKVSPAMVQMLIAYTEMALASNYAQALQGDFMLNFMTLTLKAGIDAANLQITLAEQEKSKAYLDATAHFTEAVISFTSAAISAGCLSKSSKECTALQNEPGPRPAGEVGIEANPPPRRLTEEQKVTMHSQITQKYQMQSQMGQGFMSAVNAIVKGVVDIMKGDVELEKGKIQCQIQTLQALQQMFSKELDMIMQSFQSNSDQVQKAYDALINAFSQYHQMLQAQARG
jgi:hypothetical protein